MARKSEDIKHALDTLPQPAKNPEHPAKKDPHAEIKEAMSDLLDDAEMMDMEKTGLTLEAKAAAPTPRPERSSVKNEEASSARTRDIAREHHNPEANFDAMTSAVLLRFKEKSAPIKKTIDQIRSYADSDTALFYALQPQVERLQAELSSLREEEDKALEDARKRYTEQIPAFRETQRGIEQSVQQFDEETSEVAARYDRQIQRALKELEEFFPNRKEMQDSFNQTIDMFLNEIKKTKKDAAPDSKKIEQLTQNIFDLMKIKQQESKKLPPESEGLIALEDELAGLFKKREAEFEAVRKKFVDRLAGAHEADPTPSEAARSAIMKRFEEDTAPIRAKIQKLGKEIEQNPANARTLEERRVKLARLFDSMRIMRDREISTLPGLAAETKASQKTMDRDLLDEYYTDPEASRVPRADRDGGDEPGLHIKHPDARTTVRINREPSSQKTISLSDKTQTIRKPGTKPADSDMADAA